MQLIPEIVAVNKKHTQWRRDIHAHPELAFEESRTANFVANQLESYGITVTRGLGKTGVVGTLTVGSSNKSIGLRADMDALPMDELNDFAHKSLHPGCMHGCGHDGHTVMLLAAARYLSKSKNFDGTVQFIFQPAEEANEMGSGAKAMIDDGLFERFPVDNVFAIHNAPDLMAGTIATRSGVMTASMDLFDVTIRAKGSHGAFPHEGNDPIMIAAQMLTAWQTIISRNVNAQENAVVSAASINAGDSWTVIPDTAVIRGSVRALSPQIRELIKTRFLEITDHLSKAFGAEVEINYRGVYPCCINDHKQTAFACDVAGSIFGEDRVLRTIPTDMGSEDFAYMLQERPGCYLIIGGAPIPPGEDPLKGKSIEELGCEPWLFKNACLLHQPDYDFNDEIIPHGATLFARLAEKYLSAA
jgi:hippurate hydrolase